MKFMEFLVQKEGQKSLPFRVWSNDTFICTTR